MKRIIVLVMALSALAIGSATGASDKGINLTGRLNSPFVPYRGGTVYLQVTISAHEAERVQRPPLNLAVVLDRSGSMADQGKLEYAKKAVRTLIDQLQEDDFFSFVIYDDVIEIVRQASRVGNKRDLRRLLDEIGPRGATNLGGGMIEGLRQVARHKDAEYLNRVILISDGLANRGETDPHELKRIARQYRSRSISLTSMGVGLQYNENLMMGLSQAGGGNYYFIESPGSLASIFRKELNSLSCVIAQNTVLELTPGRGVKVLDVIGSEYQTEGERTLVTVGDLAAGEHRELTVELRIPEGSGALTAVEGKLRYDGGQGWFSSWPSFRAGVRYTREYAEIERNRDRDVQARVDIGISTRKVEKALQALDEGRRDDAANELQAAKAFVTTSLESASGSAGAPALAEQKSKLESFQMLLRGKGDSSKAKKSIQYENYQTQRKR